jgi:hypothetical protein
MIDDRSMVRFCLSPLETYRMLLSSITMLDYVTTGNTPTDLVDKSFKSPGLDLNQRSLPYQDNALPN